MTTKKAKTGRGFRAANAARGAAARAPKMPRSGLPTLGDLYPSRPEIGLVMPKALLGTSEKTAKSEKYAPFTHNVAMYMDPDHKARVAGSRALDLYEQERGLRPFDPDLVDVPPVVRYLRNLFVKADSRVPGGLDVAALRQNLATIPGMCEKPGGCALSCLEGSGQLSAETPEQAKFVKTLAWALDPQRFADALYNEVGQECYRVRYEKSAKAAAAGMLPTLAVRPNGTSDIPWEVGSAPGRRGNYTSFGRSVLEAGDQPACSGVNVRFYDYTKASPDARERALRALNKRRAAEGLAPVHYSLTYSYDPEPYPQDTGFWGRNKREPIDIEDPAYKRRAAVRQAHAQKLAHRALDLGRQRDPLGATAWSVAAVFDEPSYLDLLRPGARWSLFPEAPVVDGDLHDLRFTDAPAIVALKFKKNQQSPDLHMRGTLALGTWLDEHLCAPFFTHRVANRATGRLGSEHSGEVLGGRDWTPEEIADDRASEEGRPAPSVLQRRVFRAEELTEHPERRTVFTRGVGADKGQPYYERRSWVYWGLGDVRQAVFAALQRVQLLPVNPPGYQSPEDRKAARAAKRKKA